MKKRIIISMLYGTLLISGCSNKEIIEEMDNSVQTCTTERQYEKSVETEATEVVEEDILLPPAEAFASVIQNKRKFYCTDKEPYNNRNVIHEYYGYLDEIPYNDGQMVTTRFAVVDLDGNGAPEVILEIEDYYGFVILRYREGDVYGNIVGYRSMYNLKENGLFFASGGSEDDLYGKMYFIGDTFIKDELIRRNYSSYYAKDMIITEETWKEAYSTIEKTPSAKWYICKEENVEEGILNNPLFTSTDIEKQPNEKQEYLDSLSYLLDMTYDYTTKSKEDADSDARKYYKACNDEWEKIYHLCMDKFSVEEFEVLKKEEERWSENLKRRIEEELGNYNCYNLEQLNVSRMCYEYGDIILRRTCYLVNVYFDCRFYEPIK